MTNDEPRSRTRSERGYDRLARPYERLERCLYRGDLQRGRTQLLERLPRCESALLLGDGDGRFLEAFSHSQPNCAVHSVDQSGAMLRLQRRRVSRLQNVSFQQCDAREYTPESSKFDLLVTCFFLDCFEESELRRLLPVWLSGLRGGGSFYMVDFQQPSNGWRSARARVYLDIMHRFFRWQTGLQNRRLADINGVLQEMPLELLLSSEASRGLITSRLYRAETSGQPDLGRHAIPNRPAASLPTPNWSAADLPKPDLPKPNRVGLDRPQQ